MSIKDLNDDCLAEIFKCLPLIDRLNMENVCEKWKNAARSKAWNEFQSYNAGNYLHYNKIHFKVNDPPQYIIEKVLERCGPFLNRLALDGYIQSTIMKVAGNYCYNITHLHLGLPTYPINDFIDVFEKMTNLKTIVVLTRHVFGATPTSEVKFHPKNFKSLTKNINAIHYSIGSYNKSPGRSWYKSFASIFLQFHALETLKLRDIQFDKNTFRAITKLRTLKHLSLVFCKLPSNYSKIKKLVNLESLEIERIRNVENKFIECISLGLLNLKKLIIKSLLSSKLTRQGFYNLSEPPNLKSIRICKMECEIDDTVFYQFQNLIKLECCGCSLITDIAMSRVIDNSPNLEVLNVMSTRITVATIKHADSSSRQRNYNAPKLYVYVHQNVIKDYRMLRLPINQFLVLAHDLEWEYRSHV